MSSFVFCSILFVCFFFWLFYAKHKNMSFVRRREETGECLGETPRPSADLETGELVSLTVTTQQSMLF